VAYELGEELNGSTVVCCSFKNGAHCSEYIMSKESRGKEKFHTSRVFDA
jgi:hypothetical protein